MITFKNQYNPYSYNNVSSVKNAANIASPQVMTEPAVSDVKQTLAVPPLAQSFLELAKESLVYQRLGVDKEKVDELKAEIEELEKRLQKQEGDADTIKAKINELHTMLEQEYKKARERMETKPEYEKGKLISALT